MILPDQVNLATIAFQQHQIDEELELQARVIKAREMYAGQYDEVLAEKTAALSVGTEEEDHEGINLVSIALNTKVRRLNLEAVRAEPPEDTGEAEISEDELNLQNAFFTAIFDQNNLAILQKDLHRNIERDGEAFLIVDYALDETWDKDETITGMVKFYIHERYTSAEVSWKDFPGSNEGCKAHYRNNDHNQPLDMVSKRWIETIYEDNEPVERQRMTLYINKQLETPARIEKYYLDEAGEWSQFQDELDIGWPIWWTQSGGQDPESSLPLPVIHFRNEQLEPGQKKLWGMQFGLDQFYSALVAAEVMTGHQLLVAFGFYPTTDGQPVDDEESNVMEVGPRQIIGAPNKTPKDASLDVVQPANVTPILDGIDKLAIYSSFVAGLPVANFVFSKSVASSETLRQGDSELIAQVNELITIWEKSWTDVFKLARTLDMLWGNRTYDLTVPVRGAWSPPERREINYLKIEAEAKREAGVPEATILQEVYGYTEKQAEKLLQENIAERSAGIGPEHDGIDANQETRADRKLPGRQDTP